MMHCQLCKGASLRDLITILAAHYSQWYHLGFGRSISKINLEYANQNRDYRIFEEFAYYTVPEARDNRKTRIFELQGNVYAFDFTTIDLCQAVFWWAKFRNKKGGVISRNRRFRLRMLLSLGEEQSTKRNRVALP